MAFTIETSTNPASWREVAPPTIVRIAREMGDPRASDAVGVTRPRIRTDQTGLEYERRRTADRVIEFRFQRGTLRLTLSQAVLISNALNDCEKRVVRDHERGHVRDNETLMGEMDRNLRADAAFAEILIHRRWYRHSRAKFNEVQNTIQARVAAVFRALTRAARLARDTRAEYVRMQRELMACRPGGGP